MNIIQLHERVRFWVDVVSSTRFESEDIDNGLNVAIDNKVRESYDQNRPMNKSDSFQRVQRLRDELGPLTQSLFMSDEDGYDDDGINTLPADYGWMLGLELRTPETINHDAAWHPAYPMTYNRKGVLERNPFRRPRNKPSSKYYYIERDGEIQFIGPENYTFNGVRLSYLATPEIVNYGIEYTSGHSFAYTSVVIAVEETVYNTNTYKIGDEITIIPGGGQGITSGRVVFGYTECDVRATTHEEIARRAAINLLLTSDQFDKAKALREEILAS